MGCFKSLLEELKEVQQKIADLISCKTCQTETKDEDKHPPLTKDEHEHPPPSKVKNKHPPPSKIVCKYPVPYKKEPLLPHNLEDFLAMDFETGVGRVIVEEEEIARVRRLPRYDKRLLQLADDDLPIFKQGAHLTQKYYHKSLSRENATAILRRYKKEGLWLLRDSGSRKGIMCIAYYAGGHVYHMTIKVAQYYDINIQSKIHVVTTDMELAFYDVHSLIEYYRLNLGKNFKCILGQCLENPSQRDASPPRVPLAQKTHKNIVADYAQPSTSGLFSKLGARLRGRDSSSRQ